VALALLLGLTPAAAVAQGLWEVYLLARDNDPGLRAAEASLEAARQARPKAMAALLPSVIANGTSGMNRFVDKNPATDPKTGQTASGQDYDSKKYGVYLTQQVVNLPSWAGLPQAGERVEEAEATYRASRDDFMLRVLERYLKVLAAEDKLRWVRAEKQALALALARAVRAAELGAGSPVAEQRAQAGYDLAEADEIAAENQLVGTREELSDLTGRPHAKLVALGRELDLSPPRPNDLAPWRAEALAANPALAAKAHALEASRLEVHRQRFGHLPSVNLTAGHFYEDTGGGRVPGEDVMSTVALELRVPIFEGGATTAQTREAIALHAKARQEHEAQRRLTERKVSEHFRGVNESLRRVRALRQAVLSNLAAVEAAQHGVAVGAGAMVEFMEALRDLYRARRDLTDARHEYLLSRLRLKQVAGRLEEHDLENLAGWFREDPAPPENLVSLPWTPAADLASAPGPAQ
jgi:outer membrane protein